ncbi:hypothetical protein ECG_01380 [Echinococcus granulosus]|uniref:Ovule protein n=1 Tax=Echinococcus granulosus TaxID=6210 RepID=A0A068WBC8_ECHGR|nr:hypothetical protein ECG_01380 [Echinococcus granulosus]CDS15703.1 hypothetical protein EgrG_000811300 [Echinococcus granulosus]
MSPHNGQAGARPPVLREKYRIQASPYSYFPGKKGRLKKTAHTQRSIQKYIIVKLRKTVDSEEPRSMR